MRRFKPFLTSFCLLLLLGCGGSGPAESISQPVAGNGQPSLQAGDSREVSLLLGAEDLGGGDWSLLLLAEQATDLYQIAGTLQFNPDDYDLHSVEAGGGLGSPEEAFFIHSGGAGGRLDFAYTSRYFGRVNSGDLKLLRIRLHSSGNFSLADFSLAEGDSELKLRDSQRRDLETSFRRASQ